METTPIGPKENSFLQTSPKTPTATSSSSSSSSNVNCNTIATTNTKANANHVSNNGGGSLPPLTPKTISRSEANPYPTTFIQADTTSFKQVVQMLTGSTETANKHVSSSSSSPPAPPPPKLTTGPKKPSFKLYERRHSSFKNLKINPLVPGLFNPNSASNPNSPITLPTSTTHATCTFSPRYKPEILSPSVLDLPSLVLSPVTPLIHDPFNRNSSSSSASPSPPGSGCLSVEDRVIAEKGFFFHPSPRTTPRGSEPPRLLPLFPVTSPSTKSST